MVSPIKSLFNLDPTRYTSGRNTGVFSRIGESGRTLNLDQILQGLKPPTIPENLPTVNPIGDEVTAFMESFAPAKSMHDSFRQALMSAGFNSSVASADYTLSNPWKTYKSIKYALAPSKNYQLAGLLRDIIIPQYGQYVSPYNTLNPQYESTYKPKIDAYNTEVESYNAVVNPLRAEVDAYNAEKDRRLTDVNAAMVNPDLVTKKSSGNIGEQLANKELYSDELHNLMLQKMAEVSATQSEVSTPSGDGVSRMFSAKKGT